jgi:hypothetical protein
VEWGIDGFERNWKELIKFFDYTKPKFSSLPSWGSPHQIFIVGSNGLHI